MKSFVIFIWLWISLPAFAGTQIAVTIDDLPRHADAPKGITRLQIANQILDVLDRHHLSGVYGFVNGERLSDMSDGAQILRDWVKRGQFLGNHSYAHADLNKTNVKDYEADILKNEETLKTYFPNGDFKWFRYPFLNEGITLEKREEVRSILERLHYKIAPVSITFGDWNWQDPYARCSDKQDLQSIEKLESSYLAAALTMLRYHQELSQEIFGREIKFVLLIHIGAFTARMLDRLLTLYEKSGVTFIPLETAFQDEVYRIDPKYVGEWSSPFLDQIRMARKLPKPKLEKPDHSILQQRPLLERICR